VVTTSRSGLIGIGMPAPCAPFFMIRSRRCWRVRQIRADPALHLAGRRFSADKRALIENAVALRRKPSLLQIGTEGRSLVSALIGTHFGTHRELKKLSR